MRSNAGAITKYNSNINCNRISFIIIIIIIYSTNVMSSADIMNRNEASGELMAISVVVNIDNVNSNHSILKLVIIINSSSNTNIMSVIRFITNISITQAQSTVRINSVTAIAIIVGIASISRNARGLRGLAARVEVPPSTSVITGHPCSCSPPPDQERRLLGRRLPPFQSSPPQRRRRCRLW